MIMSSSEKSGELVFEAVVRVGQLGQGAQPFTLLHREGLAKRILLHRSAPPCAG